MTQDQIETVTDCRPLPPVSLWFGVIMADWCILAPCLLLFALMCAPFVGGTWDGERFRQMTYPTIVIVFLSTILVLSGFRHFRWLYWILLGLESMIAWISACELFHWIIRWFSHMTSCDDCVGLAVALTGLVLCPLSMYLLASRRSRLYFDHLRAWKTAKRQEGLS